MTTTSASGRPQSPKAGSFTNGDYLHVVFSAPFQRPYTCRTKEKKLIGKVRCFNNAKGYGFIGREDGKDVFVHHSAILKEGYRTLSEGDSVEFEIVQGAKGPQAVNVRKVN